MESTPLWVRSPSATRHARHLPPAIRRRQGVRALAACDITGANPRRLGGWGPVGVAKEKLYKMLREHQAKGTCSHTFGALDTVQVPRPGMGGLGLAEAAEAPGFAPRTLSGRTVCGIFGLHWGGFRGQCR